MQQPQTEDRYSRETLLPMNTLYDHEHHLTQEDVDMANKQVRHIERTRNPRVPQVGDRVRYTTRHGDFHGNALIEAVREDGTRSICLCPYVPFVWATAGGIGCAVSGGPFTVVAPHALHPTGSVPGDFVCLGPLRRLRQRSRPVLRRGAVVGIPGTGIALRRFLDREMAQDQPLQGYGVPKQRSLPGRLHFVSDGEGISNVSF